MKVFFALLTLSLLAPSFSFGEAKTMQPSTGNPEMKATKLLSESLSTRAARTRYEYITRTYSYRSKFEKDLIAFGNNGWQLGGCVTSDYSTNEEWIYDRYVSLPYARTSYCIFQRPK